MVYCGIYQGIYWYIIVYYGISYFIMAYGGYIKVSHGKLLYIIMNCSIYCYIAVYTDIKTYI